MEKKPVVKLDIPRVKAINRRLTREGLVRFVDGDTMNYTDENLCRATVLDCFKHKKWTVDADAILNEADFSCWSHARENWDGKEESIFQ